MQKWPCLHHHRDPRFRLTLTAVGRSQLAAQWPGTHSRILSWIQRSAQTVLGVYLKRTCSRVTSASSALAVVNDYALYKSMHSLQIPTEQEHFWGHLGMPTAQSCRTAFPAQHRRAFSVAGPMPWKAGILSRILSGIQQTVQTALGVYSRRACLRNTTASSTLGVPIMRDI